MKEARRNSGRRRRPNRRAVARRKKAKRAAATRRLPQTGSETTNHALTNVDGDPNAIAGQPESNRVRPSFWRYFQACVTLLERGIPPTLVNIAKELRVSRQAVWALQRRHPDLLAWINTEFIGRNKEFFGPVQFRLAMLGMQGHVPAAQLYLHSLTMGFGSVDPAATVPYTVQMNYLVPRPEYPPLAPQAPLPPPLAPPLHADIPTVALR